MHCYTPLPRAAGFVLWDGPTQTHTLTQSLLQIGVLIPNTVSESHSLLPSSAFPNIQFSSALSFLEKVLCHKDVLYECHLSQCARRLFWVCFFM